MYLTFLNTTKARNCCCFVAANICIQFTKCTSVGDEKIVEWDMSVSIIAFLALSINFYYCKHHHSLFGAVASIRKHMTDTFFYHFVEQILLCHFNEHHNNTVYNLLSNQNGRERKRMPKPQWQSLIDFTRTKAEIVSNEKCKFLCTKTNIAHRFFFCCKHASQS